MLPLYIIWNILCNPIELLADVKGWIITSQEHRQIPSATYLR